MKTFIIQTDFLEQYKSGGSSNPGGGDTGNGCARVCEVASPNSAAYEACGCGPRNEEPGAPIDSGVGFLLLFTLGLSLGITAITRKKNTTTTKSNIEKFDN